MRRKPHPDVLAAAERAERLAEHLGAFALAARHGTRDLAHERRMRTRAADVDRLWTTLMRTTPEREHAMRFVASVEYAATLDLEPPAAAVVAREVLIARHPEIDDEELETDLAEAVAACRSKKKWDAVLAIILSVLGRQPYERGEDLRSEYKRWRKRLRA